MTFPVVVGGVAEAFDFCAGVLWFFGNTGRPHSPCDMGGGGFLCHLSQDLGRGGCHLKEVDLLWRAGKLCWGILDKVEGSLLPRRHWFTGGQDGRRRLGLKYGELWHAGQKF